MEPQWDEAAAVRDGTVIEHRFEISAQETGTRLDECLARRLPLLSHTKLRALVAAGAATRKGKKLSIGNRLEYGDIVLFHWQPGRIPPSFPEPIPLEVLWEDDQVLAVNKPSGMLVHATRGVKRGTLTNALLAHLNPGLSRETVRHAGGDSVLWPRFVHRLDRETSGIVLAAKSQSAARALGKALAAGSFEKEYLAIVRATAEPLPSEIRLPIARFDDQPPHWRVSEEGREALTTLREIDRGSEYSLCELRPITGRTNQLRIHTAAVGAPIVGDSLYGGAEAPRLMLHAAKLCFVHPATGNRLYLDAPVPEAFPNLWPGDWPEIAE